MYKTVWHKTVVLQLVMHLSWVETMAVNALIVDLLNYLPFLHFLILVNKTKEKTTSIGCFKTILNKKFKVWIKLSTNCKPRVLHITMHVLPYHDHACLVNGHRFILFKKYLKLKLRFRNEKGFTMKFNHLFYKMDFP